MRIVVIDIAASTGGALSVLRDFYNYVRENDHTNQWFFLLNDRYLEETDNIRICTLPQVKKSRLHKLLFDFVSGKKYIDSLKPDVVLSLQNIITFGIKAPQIVYIHQAIPFQNNRRFSFLKRSEYSLAVIQHLIGIVIKLSAKKSNAVVVQTQWMKEAVCLQCKLPEEKVLVATPEIFLPESNTSDLGFDQTTFFYPTASALYKNNGCLFKASEILNASEIPHTVRTTLPPDHSIGSVICTGRLPRDQVMEHYQHSTLVFPSCIESFGYPLAEAMRYGTIILASDLPFSHEILDGYRNAYFFDPMQPEALATLMKAICMGAITKQYGQNAHIPNSRGWKAVAALIHVTASTSATQ